MNMPSNMPININMPSNMNRAMPIKMNMNMPMNMGEFYSASSERDLLKLSPRGMGMDGDTVEIGSIELALNTLPRAGGPQGIGQTGRETPSSITSSKKKAKFGSLGKIFNKGNKDRGSIKGLL